MQKYFGKRVVCLYCACLTLRKKLVSLHHFIIPHYMETCGVYCVQNEIKIKIPSASSTSPHGFAERSVGLPLHELRGPRLKLLLSGVI